MEGIGAARQKFPKRDSTANDTSNKHQFSPPRSRNTCAKPLHAVANRFSSSTHCQKSQHPPTLLAATITHKPRHNGPPLHSPPRPTPRQRREILPRPRDTHPRFRNLCIDSRSRDHIPLPKDAHTARLAAPVDPKTIRLEQRPGHPGHRLWRRRHRLTRSKFGRASGDYEAGSKICYLRDSGY